MVSLFLLIQNRYHGYHRDFCSLNNHGYSKTPHGTGLWQLDLRSTARLSALRTYLLLLLGMSVLAHQTTCRFFVEQTFMVQRHKHLVPSQKFEDYHVRSSGQWAADHLRFSRLSLRDCFGPLSNILIKTRNVINNSCLFQTQKRTRRQFV